MTNISFCRFKKWFEYFSFRFDFFLNLVRMLWLAHCMHNLQNMIGMLFPVEQLVELQLFVVRK